MNVNYGKRDSNAKQTLTPYMGRFLLGGSHKHANKYMHTDVCLALDICTYKLCMYVCMYVYGMCGWEKSDTWIMFIFI